VSIYRECQYQESPEGSGCGHYVESWVHVPVEVCSETRGRPCEHPDRHHVFVPRSDISLDLSEEDASIVINALEAALALPEAMRKPYGLADEDKAQDLHDRLLAYMDLVAAGEAP